MRGSSHGHEGLETSFYLHRHYEGEWTVLSAVFSSFNLKCPVNEITLTLYIHGVSEKNCAKLFLSELCQISINFNNFWLVDGKMAEIIYYILIFHLTSLMLSHSLVKPKTTKFYSLSGKTVKNYVRTLSYFHQLNNFW